MQPPDSTAEPTGAPPDFAFFSGKSALASAPRWPLSRSGQPGKWRGRRHSAPGRRRSSRPHLSLQENPPAAPSRLAHVLGLQPGRRVKAPPPHGARRPITDPLTWPEEWPLCASLLGHRNWDRDPKAWSSHSAPPARLARSLLPASPLQVPYPARGQPRSCQETVQCKALPAPSIFRTFVLLSPRLKETMHGRQC